MTRRCRNCHKPIKGSSILIVFGRKCNKEYCGQCYVKCFKWLAKERAKSIALEIDLLKSMGFEGKAVRR